LFVCRQITGGGRAVKPGSANAPALSANERKNGCPCWQIKKAGSQTNRPIPEEGLLNQAGKW